MGWQRTTQPGEAGKWAPAIAVLNDQIHLVFAANNSTNTLLHCYYDGTRWTRGPSVNQSTKAGPALVALDDELLLVFVANNNSNDLLYCTYNASSGWSSQRKVGQSCNYGPGLAVHNGAAYLGFVANNNTHTLLWCSYTRSGGWTSQQSIRGERSKGSPALATHQGWLRTVFTADNSSNALLHCVFDDGSRSWERSTSMSESSPWQAGLASLADRLYGLFVANDSTRRLLMVTYDGSAWTENVLTGEATQTTPAIVQWRGQLYCVFVANDSSNTLLFIKGDGTFSVVSMGFKILNEPRYIREDALRDVTALFAKHGISVDTIGSQNITDQPGLTSLDVGSCLRGQPTEEIKELMKFRDDLPSDAVAAYFVLATEPATGGCAVHPDRVPGFVVTGLSDEYTMGHELGHVLGLEHVDDSSNLMYGKVGRADHPVLADWQITLMKRSPWVKNYGREVPAPPRRASRSKGSVRTSQAMTLDDFLDQLEPDYSLSGQFAGELPRLLEVVQGGDTSRAAKAANVAGRLGASGAPVVAAAAARPDPIVRLGAIGGAVALPSEDAIPILESLTNDGNEVVRVRAITALERRDTSSG